MLDIDSILSRVNVMLPADKLSIEYSVFDGIIASIRLCYCDYSVCTLLINLEEDKLSKVDMFKPIIELTKSVIINRNLNIKDSQDLEEGGIFFDNGVIKTNFSYYVGNGHVEGLLKKLDTLLNYKEVLFRNGETFNIEQFITIVNYNNERFAIFHPPGRSSRTFRKANIRLQMFNIYSIDNDYILEYQSELYNKICIKVDLLCSDEMFDTMS